MKVQVRVSPVVVAGLGTGLRGGRTCARCSTSESLLGFANSDRRYEYSRGMTGKQAMTMMLENSTLDVTPTGVVTKVRSLSWIRVRLKYRRRALAMHPLDRCVRCMCWIDWVVPGNLQCSSCKDCGYAPLPP